MKTITTLFLCLLSLCSIGATATRIINLPERSSINANDFLMVDRDAAGVGKIRMSSLGSNIVLTTSGITVKTNLASLAEFTGGTNGSSIFVAGNSTYLDWGPMLLEYVLDESSSADTNRFTIANAGGSGRWLHMWDGKPEAFGAVADGSTDSTPDINAALLYSKGTNFGPWFMVKPTSPAKEVRLSPGVYRASQIVLQDGVKLVGAATGTMIKQTDNANVPLVLSSNVVGWTIRDIVFDGNRDSNTNANIFEMLGTQYGLLGTHMSRCVLQNGSTNAFYIAIGGATAVFHDVVVKNCYGRGFDIYSMSDSKLSNLDVSFCRAGGLRWRFGGQSMLSDSKFWANRIANDIITTTLVIPVSTDVGFDEAAVEVAGSGHMWSNVDVQENGSIGMRIGTLQYQCSDSTFKNLLVDMNGGIDVTNSVLYERDGLQFVNYYNVSVQGIAKDSRANQGKGRQGRGVAFLGTIPTFTSNTVAAATGFLFNDDWYRIADTNGGAIFTNIQYSLATKRTLLATCSRLRFTTTHSRCRNRGEQAGHCMRQTIWLSWISLS